MQEEQTFYPVTTEYFTACLPLLEKYFGITAGYFNKELSRVEKTTISCVLRLVAIWV